MAIAIAYEAANGERLEFGGSDESLHYFENELFNAEWGYTSSNGRVGAFHKDVEKLKFKVGIAASTEAEGLALRERLIELTERDVLNGTMGRLVINGWYLPCFVYGRSYGEWWHGGRFLECEMLIVCEGRTWYRDNFKHFYAKDEGSSGYGLSLPHDFPHDYGTSPMTEASIANASLSPSNALIRFYGACSDPHVIIAGNAYGVYGKFEAGGMVEIDTKAQTITRVTADGVRTNAFGSRYEGGEASNSYVFKQVPAGVSDISASGDFAFDVCVYEHRSEPEWS